jgi:hypothetical protein
MKQPVYLIVGVPGSGKTWITEQVKDLFTFVHHDGFIGHINQPEVYVEAILEAAETSTKPLLAEAPFSVSSIADPLEAAGYSVIPVLISEPEDVIAGRYRQREGKDIPKGHLTRLRTYQSRAEEFGWYSGTSEEVRDYLKGRV